MIYARKASDIARSVIRCLRELPDSTSLCSAYAPAGTMGGRLVGRSKGVHGLMPSGNRRKPGPQSSFLLAVVASDLTDPWPLHMLSGDHVCGPGWIPTPSWNLCAHVRAGMVGKIVRDSVVDNLQAPVFCVGRVSFAYSLASMPLGGRRPYRYTWRSRGDRTR